MDPRNTRMGFWRLSSCWRASRAPGHHADRRRNFRPGEIVVTLSRRLVRRSDAGRVSGGPPPTSPATGWQVKPDTRPNSRVKPGPSTGSGNRSVNRVPVNRAYRAAWIWRWRAASVTVVMRGIARHGGCPACTACGVFLVAADFAASGGPSRSSHGQSAAGNSSGSGWDSRRSHQRRTPYQRAHPRSRGQAGRPRRRAGRDRCDRRRAPAGPGSRPRPGRGRADGAAAGLQAHGLRQVQVRVRAEGQGIAQEPGADGHQGDQAPAEDRPARLRHQEGPRRAVPQGRATRSR